MKIKGIFTPTIVPFTGDGTINENELRRLTAWLVEKGIHGLYPNGSTGEFIRLSYEERLKVVRIMAKENRELRISAAEKKAAALPAKLTVPMIVFFLPVLFAVIMGPAMIQISGYMK